ncbi:MAG: hypothetical protein JW912_06115 [Sedimentisphaerales bacterium]|nr:hypothetical protein [Sedimentisphaerales bacterium]
MEKKEFYKETNFYFIIIPALATIWAVSTWVFSMPTAEKKWQRNLDHYAESQTQIERILAIDPERLDIEEQKGQSAKFDYATSVENFARVWKIPSSSYSLQARREIKRAGQITKSATVQINPIDIETFTQFLTAMMYRWPDLQCDTLKLTKQKDGPDAWKADIKLTYYY